MWSVCLWIYISNGQLIWNPKLVCLNRNNLFFWKLWWFQCKQCKYLTSWRFSRLFIGLLLLLLYWLLIWCTSDFDVHCFSHTWCVLKLFLITSQHTTFSSFSLFFSSDFLLQNHSYKVLECSFSCTPAFWSVSGMLLLIRLLFSSICRNWQYFQLLSIMVRNTTSLSFLLPFAFSQANALNHWLDLCAHNNISKHEA